MDEMWKPIIGYENTYSVSNFGRVMRTATAHNSKAGHILNLYNKRGYLQVVLTQNGIQRWFAVHKLVAEAFISKKLPKLQVNHKDGNKTNNTPENLEWVTCLDNIRHSQKILGYDHKGTHNGRAKLTENQVVQIRELYAAKKYSQIGLAILYGVSLTTLHNIIHYKLWPHLDDSFHHFIVRHRVNR